MPSFAFLVESLAVQAGGPARVAAVVSAELAARGHKVEIWTLDEGDIESVPVSPGVAVVKIAPRSLNPLHWLRAAKEISRRSQEVDVVIVSGVWGPVDGLALRLAGVPPEKLRIRTCGMLEDYILRRSPVRKWVARRLYVDANLARAGCLLVNTEIERQNVLRLGVTDRIVVIPNGVRLPESPLSRSEAAKILGLPESDKNRYLLYLGRMHPKKGLHLLLPAFAGFRRTAPGWKLLVAGSFSDEEYATQVRHLVERYSLEDDVHFVGEVAGEKKTACFAISHAFTLPSASEGFPNAVIEAIAWGLPALLTPGCNFPELARASGGVEVEQTSPELEKGLQTLLADDERRVRMGAEARRLVAAAYSLDSVVDGYAALASLCEKKQQAKAGILFADFGPYHVARIEALAAELQAGGMELAAFRMAETSSTYGWKPVAPQGVEVYTLAGTQPTNARDALRLARSFHGLLRALRLRAVFLPSYSPLPNLLCLLATKLAGTKAIMMNESWAGTEKAGPAGRLAKHLIFRLFDAAVVGGRPQAAYARGYGISPEAVFQGYDVVDNAHFAREADKWRETPAEKLPVSGLPERFFLNLGRFVPKKNLSLLIEAYAIAMRERPSSRVALVLAGSGEELPELQKTAARLGLATGSSAAELPDGRGVVFFPFQQVTTTPVFFAKAMAFVLPSSHEEWGLVVNEAMACGTPVIVSNRCGCAQDLVVEGVTGRTFDPSQVEDLASILVDFLDDPAKAGAMGKMAAGHIAHWAPSTFGRRGWSALASVLDLPTPQRKRALFLVESLSVASGGTATEVATIASALADAGTHDVTVVTCPSKGASRQVSPGVNLVELRGNKPSLNCPLAVWRLKRVLARHDAVFVTGLWGPFDGFGLRIAWPEKARVFIRVCGMLQPYILQRNRWKKALGRALYVDANLNRADGLIVNSASECGHVASLGFRAPLRIIRNGTPPPPQPPERDQARAKFGLHGSAPVFLYLGRIHPKKGLHVFLEAMQQAAAGRPSFELPRLLVGGTFSDAAFRAEIEDLCRELPEQTVTFLGEITGDAKEAFFAAGDLFVLPSESEGLPNAVLESLARGVPAMVTTGCNLPEVGECDAGRVVPFGVESFVEVIRWFSSLNEEELRALRANAQKLIRTEFSMQGTVDAYSRLIGGASFIEA